MPTNEYSKNIIYLSKEQYNELITNETLTVNGQTITYNENDIYVTPQEEPVTDIKINETSIVTGGVANIPIATEATPGLAFGKSTNGISINSSGQIKLVPASSAKIKGGTNDAFAIVPNYQHESAFYGLAKAAGHNEKDSTLPAGQYTESAKSAIHEMLNGPVEVTGTTPVITALPGIRYMCGEVATLDVTLPASGIVDVVFESGSTPTVLTVTPPTGVTLKWANGFDPTSLEADTTYEINIADGLGVAAAWT